MKNKKKVGTLEVLKPITQKLTIEDVIPENTLNEEAKNELNKTKKVEKMVDRENLYCKTNKYTHNFQNFWTISTFGRENYNNGTIETTKKVNEDQSDLLVEILNFSENSKIEKKKRKKTLMFLKTCIIFLKVEKDFLMLLMAKYFP